MGVLTAQELVGDALLKIAAAEVPTKLRYGIVDGDTSVRISPRECREAEVGDKFCGGMPRAIREDLPEACEEANAFRNACAVPALGLGEAKQQGPIFEPVDDLLWINVAVAFDNSLRDREKLVVGERPVHHAP
jgi:hypothetical protein